MSYMETQIERQYEAWMEQQREWYDTCNELAGRDGWTYIELGNLVTGDMVYWLTHNCHGEFDYFDHEVLIKDSEKATMFALKFV